MLNYNFYLLDDGDHLSYVSAPMSDYSVTTIGSEMNRTRTQDDDESEEEENGEEFQLPDDDEEPNSNNQIAPDTFLNKQKRKLIHIIKGATSYICINKYALRIIFLFLKTWQCICAKLNERAPNSTYMRHIYAVFSFFI